MPDEWEARQAIPVILQVSSSHGEPHTMCVYVCVCVRACVHVCVCPVFKTAEKLHSPGVPGGLLPRKSLKFRRQSHVVFESFGNWLSIFPSPMATRLPCII